MGLTNKKEEQLRKMPMVDASVSRSKDGRFLIHKTTITHIKPAAYYQAVLDGKAEESGESLGEAPAEALA